MPKEDAVELRWILAVVRRRLWLIAGCALLAAVLAYGATSWMAPVYRSTTTLLVKPAQDTGSNEYNFLVAGERLALTYSEMVKGRVVSEAVTSWLALEDTPEALAKRITVEPIKDTQLVRLSVTDSDPSRAALLANTVAEAFTQHVQMLQEERYRNSLAILQTKMDALLALIDVAQEETDSLIARDIEEEAELERLQGLLAEYRSDYRALQEDYQDLQLMVTQLTDNVKVVESAQEPRGPDRSPYEISLASLAPHVQLPPRLPQSPYAYTATVTLLVDQTPLPGESDYSAILASERLALTYGQMLEGRSVMAAAAALLGTTESPEELAKRVSVEPIPGTQLIRLSVKDTDALQATRAANAISGTFVEQIEAQLARPYADRLSGMQAQLDRLLALTERTKAEIESLTAQKVETETALPQKQALLSQYRSDYRTFQQEYDQLRQTAFEAADTVVVTESAVVPESPLPYRMLYTALAVVIGAMLGLGIAFLWESLDETIRTSDDVNRLFGRGAFGTIGRLAKTERGLVILDQPRAPVSESFRMLAANIRLAAMDSPLRTLVITSPTPEAGKTVIAANLAIALAKSGLSIVAVDADLRLPRLGEMFGLDMDGGLTGSLQTGSLDGNLSPTYVRGLQVLTSGEVPPDPTEALSSPNLTGLLEQLAGMADLVLIDSPPILPVADTTVLASVSDGVLLVVRAGHTGNRAARDALKSLRRARAQVVGVILNAVPNPRDSYYKYYGKGQKRATMRLPHRKPRVLQ